MNSAAIAEQAAVVLFVRAVTKASLWGFWKGVCFALIRVSLTRVLKGVLPSEVSLCKSV